MLDWSDRPPAATFDLHGQTVSEAAVNVERYLRTQAKARPGAIVRVITGRGRGRGRAPIRTRVRTLLRGLRDQGAVVRDFVLEETEGSFLVRLLG
jgi:DNA-nicking Smr family endonuclease